MRRLKKLTKVEIHEKLQSISEGMINASFARDAKTCYELFEESGELQHMLTELATDDPAEQLECGEE